MSLFGGITLRVPGLALAADRQHEHRVHFGHVLVQGNIAMRPTTNHKFAPALGSRTTDQRVLLQHIERGNNLADALAEIFDVVLRQMVEDAFEIFFDLGRQLNARHFQRASLRVIGRFAVLPAIRASR